MPGTYIASDLQLVPLVVGAAGVEVRLADLHIPANAPDVVGVPLAALQVPRSCGTACAWQAGCSAPECTRCAMCNVQQSLLKGGVAEKMGINVFIVF